MAEPLTIACRENGPLVVRGPVKVIDHLGNAYELPTGKETIALCRCGQSGSKPFCDGTHKKIGFLGAPLAPARAVEDHARMRHAGRLARRRSGPFRATIAVLQPMPRNGRD